MNTDTQRETILLVEDEPAVPFSRDELLAKVREILDRR